MSSRKTGSTTYYGTFAGRSRRRPPGTCSRGACRKRTRPSRGSTVHPIERLRLLSVLFAAGASALTALWALRLLGGLLPGLLAGFLVACRSVPSIYGGQLRAYALLRFLAAAFGLFLVVSSSRPTRWPLIAVAIVVWLGVMTHYFFGFTVAAGALWLWTTRPPPAGRRLASVALVFGLLGFLPWLGSARQQMRHGRYDWIGSFDVHHVVTLPGSLFFGPEGVVFGVARLTVSVAIVVGIVVLWRRPEGRAIVALAILPIVCASAIWFMGQPIFNERNLLTVAPFIAILVAASLLALPERSVRPVALVSLGAIVLATAVTNVTLGWIAYDRIASSLVELGWKPTEPVLVIEPTSARTSLRASLGWYLPGHPVLIRATGSRRRCPARFVIGRAATLAPWLGRRHLDLRTREFAAYDHPFRGRPDGRLLVAGLRDPVDILGANRLHVRSPGWRCPTPNASN